MFIKNPRIHKLLEEHKKKDPKLHLVKEARKLEFEKLS
jgi:hypothetical protein